MRAVVLAGGLGTRLRPLTYRTPKPLIPLLNVPLLEHVLAYLREQGVEEIYLALSYRAEDVMGFLEERHPGARIQCTVEREPMGTAGALQLVLPFLPEEPVIVMNGDIFTEIPVARLLETHREKRAKLTIALREVEDPSRYGLVQITPEGRVERFVEKPSDAEYSARTVNAGIYIMEPEILRAIPAGRRYSLERELFPRLLEQGVPVYAEVFGEYWMDVGTFQSYFQVTRDLLTGRTRSPALPPAGAGNIWIGEGAQIQEGAEVAGNVVIGPQTVIEEGAYIGEFTVLGPHCLVRREAQIRESILLEGVVVGARASLRGSLLGNRVLVEDDATLAHGNVLADGAVIPRGSRLPL